MNFKRKQANNKSVGRNKIVKSDYEFYFQKFF